MIYHVLNLMTDMGNNPTMCEKDYCYAIDKKI